MIAIKHNFVKMNNLMFQDNELSLSQLHVICKLKLNYQNYFSNSKLEQNLKKSAV